MTAERERVVRAARLLETASLGVVDSVRRFIASADPDTKEKPPSETAGLGVCIGRLVLMNAVRRRELFKMLDAFAERLDADEHIVDFWSREGIQRELRASLIRTIDVDGLVELEELANTTQVALDTIRARLNAT